MKKNVAKKVINPYDFFDRVLKAEFITKLDN